MNRWKTGLVALSLAFNTGLAMAHEHHDGDGKDKGAACQRKTTDEKSSCACCCRRDEPQGLGSERKNPYVSPGQQSGWGFDDSAPAKCERKADK